MEQVLLQPASIITRRAPKNHKPIQKDVLRDYHSEICSTLNVCADTLQSFALKLFAQKIIDRSTKLSVERKGGQSGASVLLDHVELKVEQKPKLLNVVLEIMESEENLCYIAKEIKGESDSDEETVPSDSMGDNEFNYYTF